MLPLNLQKSEIILIIALAAMLALLVIMLVLLARQGKVLRRDRERLLSQLRRENEIQGRSVQLLNQTVGNSVQQVAELSGTLDARMDALTRRSDESLSEMRRMVGEKLDSRLSESFRIVNGQLADVHRGIGEMREMAQNVTDLKKVLGNVKTRGIWGEMQLRAVMEQMFAANQYIENAAIPEGSATRVEFALKLPLQNGGHTLLPIDSKFPQEDYLRLVEAEAAGDAAAREKSLRLLERAVIEQAKMISEKYIRPPQTADFAVMFLPVEGLYAEVSRLPGLIERLQSRLRILVAGPNTLCALLTSLQMGLRTSALEQRSGEILQMFEELRAEFTHFQEGMVRARQRIEQAESELDALEARARKIAKKLK